MYVCLSYRRSFLGLGSFESACVNAFLLHIDMVTL